MEASGDYLSQSLTRADSTEEAEKLSDYMTKVSIEQPKLQNNTKASSTAI